MLRLSWTSSVIWKRTAETVPAPETSALPPSSLSCTSWSTEFPQRWSRFSAFWPFQQRKRIPVLCATSPPTRCNRSWMLPIQQFETVSGIGRCCICVLPEALRVSELVGLRTEDLFLQPQASILVHGKGRKERCLPLWKETASALRAWLTVRGKSRAPELFLNARGTSMTRAGFEYILDKHVCAATKRCPSLSTKRISPHVLRHTCALTILQATKDLRKVSLWLGHSSMQTTEIYTRADPSVKLEALESVIAPKLRTGRFKATDQLIAMLKATPVMRSEKPST